MGWKETWSRFCKEKRSNLATSVLIVTLVTAAHPASAQIDDLDGLQPLKTVLASARDRSVRFVLTSGKTVVGRVAMHTADMLRIRKPSGGLVTLSLQEIAKARIRDASGEMVDGRLVQMSDGRIGWERDHVDRPNASDAHTTKAKVDKNNESGGPLVYVDDGFLRQAQGVTETNATRPSDDSSNRTSPPRLTMAADDGEEGASDIRFHLSLSEPADRSILIIYSTVNGTAKAPDDYRHDQGVVVFEPGQKEASISASIVDDDVKEDDETLSIFITADPAAVLIEDRKVAATISDDD
ncbi:MAG: Calx-beta domain-containing protein [Pseudomonadota bacterium]